MTPHPTIVVLAKAPVPGRAKTRLCPPLSPVEAAALAAAALSDTLGLVAEVSGASHVLALDGDVCFDVPPSFDVVGQGDGGLGQRLDRVLDRSDGPCVVIGMDTPQLGVAMLADALARLVEHEAVLGPADDGGFWAIGRSRRTERLFDDVPMSTPRTGSATLERLGALGLRTAILPRVRDVDEFADAVAVAGEARGTRFAAELEAICGTAVG